MTRWRMPRRWRSLAALFVLVVVLMGLWETRRAIVIPPSSPDNPVTVYAIGYPVVAPFSHNSLVLPRVDATPDLTPDSAKSGEFVEYSYGDRAVYANNDDRLVSLARAVLYPTPGTLGRRSLDADDLRRLEARPDARWLSLTVARDRVTELLAQLDRRYAAANATPQYNPSVALHFVPDAEGYWALNTCNHAVARWLKELGCRLRGSPFWGRFVARSRISG